MNPSTAIASRIAQLNDQIANLQARLDDETDDYLAEMTQNFIDLLTSELASLENQPADRAA